MSFKFISRFFATFSLCVSNSKALNPAISVLSKTWWEEWNKFDGLNDASIDLYEKVQCQEDVYHHEVSFWGQKHLTTNGIIRSKKFPNTLVSTMNIVSGVP